MLNRYVKRSRISEKKFREIIKMFSMDLDATQVSELTNISRNSINKYGSRQVKRVFSKNFE